MKIIELLNTGKRWCKFYLAKTAQDYTTMPEACNAAKWCLIGAVQKCYSPGQSQSRAEGKLMAAINAEFPNHGLTGFNKIVEFNNADSTTFRKIRRVLRRAKV